MVKLEKSTVHVYLAPFLGVHAQIQWSKFHDTRLIGCTRLLGTPEYFLRFQSSVRLIEVWLG